MGGGWPSRPVTRHRMPHPWRFHGWATANSPPCMFIGHSEIVAFLLHGFNADEPLVLVNETGKQSLTFAKSPAPMGGWPSRTLMRHRMPLDKNEGAVKDKDVRSGAEHRCFAREVEDQDSGNLTLNHLPRKIVPPTIDSA